MTEFGFIEGIKTLCNSLPSNNFEGIGDDCAILPISSDESLVFTSDMVIERIHFLREATSAYELGRKSLTVNLSDVAAMGAQPVASLLSLSIPKELTGEWIEEFMRGYTDLSRETGVALIGGDTTAAKCDLSINVTAIGRCTSRNIKRRCDAKVGDTIFVTAPLGGSGQGLNDILTGNYNSTLATLHKNPTARIEEGVWLGTRNEVHAMMDISDGIASDLRHILKASSVGATIELTQVPHTEGVDLRTALSAGEDYELLLTSSDPERVMQEYYATFSKPLYPIGTITDCNDIKWLEDGAPATTNFKGFTHY